MSDGVSKINGVKPLKDMSMEEIDAEFESFTQKSEYKDTSIFDLNGDGKLSTDEKRLSLAEPRVDEANKNAETAKQKQVSAEKTAKEKDKVAKKAAKEVAKAEKEQEAAKTKADEAAKKADADAAKAKKDAEAAKKAVEEAEKAKTQATKEQSELKKAMDEAVAKEKEEKEEQEKILGEKLPEETKNHNAALTYQYAPIKNITVNMKNEADRKELTKAMEGVAQIIARTETGGLDFDTVRNYTIQEIDEYINSYKEAVENADEGEDVSAEQKVLNAFSKLKDVVVKHKDNLGDGRFRYETPATEEEEPGVLAATGEAIADGAKFIDKNVLRVSDARQGAKNAGKRVEAQYKVNGVGSGLISTVGNTAALGTTAASGIIGTVTDAGEALTDAVDNMDEGLAKDAAKTGSGIVKVGNGILNAGGALVDGVSSFAKEGFYINRLWGGKGNDEALDELAKKGLDNLVASMLPKTKKEGETDEEFAKRVAQDKIEHSYIVNVQHLLGLSSEALAKMDADEVRSEIVEAVNNEKIPVEVIKAFAPERIAKKGMTELSELLNTDGQEGLAKGEKAASQIVDGIADVGTGLFNTVTFGLFKSDKKEDAKAVTGAAAPVHTASTKELTQAERDKKLAEWKADFMPKYEANKEKVLNAILPPEFIATAIEESFKYHYKPENMTDEQIAEAKNEIKREIYEELGAQLATKFSDYEAHRLFTRNVNAGEFGEDSFWAGFWNEIDNAKEQENNAGDRGFLKNFGSYLYGVAKFPATAVLTDAPYTIAGVAGGIPFWQYQVAFSLFLGSDEHIRGTKNIIEGKYNGAQKAAGWDENGYATVKDIVVWWSKHHTKRIFAKKEKPAQSKPEPEPEPRQKTPNEIFYEDPSKFHVTD